MTAGAAEGSEKEVGLVEVYILKMGRHDLVVDLGEGHNPRKMRHSSVVVQEAVRISHRSLYYAAVEVEGHSTDCSGGAESAVADWTKILLRNGLAPA